MYRLQIAPYGCRARTSASSHTSRINWPLAGSLGFQTCWRRIVVAFFFSFALWDSRTITTRQMRNCIHCEVLTHFIIGWPGMAGVFGIVAAVGGCLVYVALLG